MEGRCKSGAHKSSNKTEEEKEQEVPVISLDYMFPERSDSTELGIESLPIIAGIDRRRKSYMAHMVLEKGKNPFAIAMISREVELTGYN